MKFVGKTLQELIIPGGYECSCGRRHVCELKYLKIGRGIVTEVPVMLEAIGAKKPFVVCDESTWKAAGARVDEILNEAGIEHINYLIPMERPKPGEWEVGSVVMHLDPTCDLLLAVGSGVLNDICKVVSLATGIPNAVVGTAPSMDGYASNSSSMEVNKVKSTLYNHAPCGILLDTEILAQAPMRMLQAGFGDMIAKYIATCEWRMAHLVTEEYYCEEVAALMRHALSRVVAGVDGIPARDPDAVGTIAEGLVLAGIAMAYANISRPASGLEHYFSHMWEMMALERDEPYDLHGIQVGVGSVLTLKLYKHLRVLQPSREKAEAHMAAFDPAAWEAEMHRIFGKTTGEVLEIEARAHKNDPAKHAERLTRILNGWEEICCMMDEELPDLNTLRAQMEMIGEPTRPSELNISLKDTVDAFIGSRDIRDKYMSCSLIWDLGETDTFVEYLKEEAEI